MKHVTHLTAPKPLPARASLLETQQKVEVFSTLASGLVTFGEALETFLGLGQA